jgi:hypothetical protein
VARHRATDEESPFHTLFRRWSLTKLAIGEFGPRSTTEKRTNP